MSGMIPRRGLRCARLFVALSCVLGFSVEAAEAPRAAPEPLPVEAYVAPADFVQVALSPSGRYLAALTPVKGKRNLVVLDLQSMKPRAVTAMSSFDIISYRWVGDYLLYSLGTLDTPTGADSGYGGGLFAVKADGTGYRELSPTVEKQINENVFALKFMNVLSAVPGRDNEVLVSANLRTDREDIYSVNLETGRRTLLSFEKPGLVRGWTLDQQGALRVALVVDKEDVPMEEVTTTILYRDTVEQPWRKLASFAHEERGGWVPVAFAPDNRNLIVQARRGNTSGWFLLDVDTGKVGEQVMHHPRFDASEASLRFATGTRKVIGLVMADERQQVAYFDEAMAKLQSAMEAQFPGKMVNLSRSADGTLTLVAVWSDRLPRTYYLYDERAKSLKQVLRSRRNLDERHLVEMRPFLLKTRDGVEIPSYYFLPASYQPGQKLPTVVHIHGGPHARADTWGPLEGTGVREAQVLASRGYAVVLPNFRMTPGLGWKVYNGGFGQIGRQMSDDHEDAAKWAVAQGFADARRICISGSSYGGYASLWATIRSAEVFKCAMAGHVVSDLELQLTSTKTDFHSSKAGIAFWRRMIGEKVPGQWALSNEVSPARHAERSAMPLFIYAGDADRRTPLEQTQAMVDALKLAGKPPEIVMVKLEEAHGYGKTENRVELYKTMLDFLGKHIGRGPSEPSAPAGQ